MHPMFDILCLGCNENPAKCEVHAAPGFITAKKYSVADIHQDICTEYGLNLLCMELYTIW